jgi:hypothetical protein
MEADFKLNPLLLLVSFLPCFPIQKVAVICSSEKTGFLPTIGHYKTEDPYLQMTPLLIFVVETYIKYWLRKWENVDFYLCYRVHGALTVETDIISKIGYLVHNKQLVKSDCVILMHKFKVWNIITSHVISISLWLYSPCQPWPLFQFLNINTVSRTPWTGDRPVVRPLPTHRTRQTQNKRTQASMPWAGFEPTTPAFERAKTTHSLDRSATVIGSYIMYCV